MSPERLAVVAWLWKPHPRYRSQFRAEHVNILARMVARNLHVPHRFVCITDDPTGLECDWHPLWPDHATVLNPRGELHPSCYRRLKLFAPDAASIIGAERILSIDLDCVITGDITPLATRPEDFVIWGDTAKGTPYNGGLWLLRAGTRPRVWTEFDPHIAKEKGRRLGYIGSDQAWIGACLGTKEARFTRADGVYSYRNELAPNGGALPRDARITLWHGSVDPDSPTAQRLAWVRQHYR